ncbi:centromere protein V-like isoform X2 [Xenia sp. Carnegie-2017]|uniref:centromere protein V-like isoform X2 n=1 Tax=Xenia sp. Carnegie-2017 TaxID=2897299 RepID=UPI001F04B482|nr:centromere protein V-like isoform X2 [Xenia sp. Carnegie-2017]
MVDVTVAKYVFKFPQKSCSICRKKQNLHFIVPDAAFKILKGEDNLTCYTFNLHKAKHLFCKSCGVQSFYKPRSNPNGYGIMPHCIDEDDAQRLKTNMKYFDGENWEKAIVVNKEILTKSNEPN